MAYVSKEKKAGIKAALDKVIPKGWKWSLAVRDHSVIVLTISKGPRDLTILPASFYHQTPERQKFDRQVSDVRIGESFPEGDVNETMKKVAAALNMNNYDNSDAQTDYFDVGHYVNINVGRWDKPFVIVDVPGKVS